MPPDRRCPRLRSYETPRGTRPALGNGAAPLREGVTLLTAARNDQTAAETDEGRGLFSTLQRCRAAKLVEPMGTPHPYEAAVNSRSCRLTPLERHDWRLASEGLN